MLRYLNNVYLHVEKCVKLIKIHQNIEQYSQI